MADFTDATLAVSMSPGWVASGFFSALAKFDTVTATPADCVLCDAVVVAVAGAPCPCFWGAAFLTNEAELEESAGDGTIFIVFSKTT